MPAKYTEAKKINNKRWDNAHIERLTAAVPAGTTARIKAVYPDLSVSAFCKNAIIAALNAAEAQSQVEEEVYRGRATATHRAPQDAETA